MEDMQKAVKTVLNNYANFDGRSGRAEFWWWALAYFLGGIIISFVGGLIGMGSFLYWIYLLALIVPFIAVGIRRFHDIGKPAIWAVSMIIPFVNLIVALIFLTKPSDGPNEHGEGPQPLAA
ncbi:MAG: DUF805 domain-containing protein [Hyphococcus sp.]|nr:MAG: DUF805 domain-containing protein [Marinicaulis sp.]